MKKKSILVFLTLLIGVVILAFAINNVSTPKIENENDDNSSKVELVANSSELIEAINNAPSDYETTTTISLTNDTTLGQNITIKSGQIIEIVSKPKDFSLGKTDLGYTLDINQGCSIILERQAKLILSTNVELITNSSIYAEEQHSSAPDFYASLEINDSLMINGGNLYTDYFANIDVNGSLNLAKGIVGHNNDTDATGLNVANVNINEDAALIQIGGSISTNLEGDGIYVYSNSITSGLANTSNIKSESASITSNLAKLNEGSYILNPKSTDTIYSNSVYETIVPSFSLNNNLNINKNINIFPFEDMFINAQSHINVSNGATFGFGGLIDGGKYYSAGTNTILFDGGANWTLYDDTPGSFNDNSSRVDFVDGKYDTSVTFNQQVNYGRSTYNGIKATNKTPLIGVNEATLNIFRGIVLQNNFNTQNKDTTKPFGGGIGIYNTSTLNYYGARVLYNANTYADDDLGGAGIGVTYNSTINMYDGEINYNSLCGGFGKKSGDGAGINLTGGSKLVMSGGTIGYNHGDDASNADGGGVIARQDGGLGGSSDIKITNGNIVGNFVKGYGGAICLWHSNVSITGGKVDGNRATFGGGIATSSNAQSVTVTLDKDEFGNLTEITNNTAYINNGIGGYGGGICVGNDNSNQFKKRQTVEVNDAYIANNTANYGGGIANYSSAGTNNNKLILNGGTIVNNKAYDASGSLDLSHGYGIYSTKATTIDDTDSENDDDYNGTNHMVELSGAIRVDTSNNIVFANINSGQIPIKVTGNLTTDGIVGLIRYADENSYNNSPSPNVVEFNSGVNVNLDKFLLDNAYYKFAVNGNCLNITQVTENDAFANVNGQNFSTLQDAMEYITNTENKIYTATIKIMNNKAITSDDIISIPNGYNITIRGNSGIKTLSISPSFGASSTLFAINSGASLKLEDIIIDGNSSVSQGHLIIQNNGTFELSQKSKIINNKGQNGYASVIEVAYRAQSITNIYGEISGNFGDSEYGVIYLGHSNAILNVYDGASIDNSTAESPIDDIILEAGTITLGDINNERNNISIGTIIKQGNGQIIANNLVGMKDNPIDISVNEIDYTHNRLIISVNDNNSTNLANYSDYFNLINKHNRFDSLVYRNLSYGLVINNVLEIIVDFKDAWVLNGKIYQKGEYLDNSEINEDAFDSNKELNGENYNPNEEFDPDSVNLGGIAGELSLRYPITFHNGSLVFNIDSSSQLSLEKVTSIVSRSGYNILDYVIHNGTQETSSEYRSTSSSLDVSAFEGLDSIYLGVNWSPLNYIFEFNNGGLITANGNMGTQNIEYTSIETTNLLANKYYATGFRFIGWKIVVSTTEAGQKSYLKLNGEDVILENETQFNRNTYLITDLQNENNGNTTFVLEAQWESIFNGTNTINNVGTSSTAAFKIESKEALEIFAATVNGESVENYYNAVDEEGNLIYKADDYLTEDGEIYYFSLESDIQNFNGIIGSNSYNFISGAVIDFNQIIADSVDKKPFSGNFNGNNHSIELNITGNNNFVGLFGYTKNATISNLTITGNISGNVSIGGLVGFAYGGNFDNIRNKATIRYTGSNVGGIFGTYYLNNNDNDNITGSIRNVYNEGNLSYSEQDGQDVDYAPTWSESSILYYYPGTRVGGIIGQSWDASLTNAFNAGSISAKYGVGGIIGTMLSSDEESRTNSMVTTAFNAGTVTATAGLGAKYQNYGDNVYQVNAYAGGIVGRIFGSATVNDAMNTNKATVSATWTGTYTENANGVTFTYSKQNPTIGGRGVGGIIGVTSIDRNDDGDLDGGNKTISNVINTGKVTGWTHIGGISGILAYSDLSYSINVGNLEAKGTVSVGNGNHAFLGGLVGMGIAANLFSTAIFDGDITYKNYTDYTIQSIGDISANSLLGYDANNINSLKLSSSQIVCKPNNQKPSGLDSTFFESGWTWKTYDKDADGKSYYPQLVSFADTDGHKSTALVHLNDKTVAELSKTAISLKQEGQDVTEEYKVDITLNLGNAVKLIDQSGNPITDSIEITVKNKNNSLDTKTINFSINSNPNGYVTSIVAQGLSYIEYRDYIIDLSSIKASLNRIGYTFDDWYRDGTFTEKFNNNLYLEKNEIYVNWTTTKYQISYSNINAYVAGEVNLPTNYINIFTVNDNNFTLITNDDLKNGNDYIGNGAYDFETWQYVIGTTPYPVDGFNIISDNGEYFVQLVNDGNPLSIDLIPIKNLEFRMYCTPYSYSIKYDLGDVSGGEQVTNNNRQTYTIEDEIVFNKAEKTGYDFMGWYTTPKFEESSKITSIPRGTVGNRNEALKLYAKFEEAEQRLTFDLNGGTLTETSITFNGNTYEIHYDNKDETNYILIKYKTPLIGFHDALIAIIEAPNNGTTASTITKTETGSQEVTDDDIMGPSDMRVYVNYEVTEYTITINPGLTNNQLSFANIDISNITTYLDVYEIKEIEIANDNIIIKAEYGANLQLLLGYLQYNLDISDNYVFNGYYNNPNSLSIYNLRLDGDQENISITFLWTLDRYHLEILDVYNQIIITINNENNYGVVNNEGVLDIQKLTKYINDNCDNLAGYTFANKFTNLQGVEIDTNYSLKGYSTLIAKYENNVYDVSFNKNYSADDQNLFTETDYTNKKLTYDKVIPQDILSLKPTRPGYDFVGWSYERNGQPLTSSQIYNLIPEDSDETLYAIWEESTYVIQYEFIYDSRWDNTSVDVSSLPKTYVFNGGDININNVLTQLGYEFTGWSLDDSSDPTNIVTINADVAVNASNNVIVIYGHFEIEKYTLKFNADGGLFSNNSEEIEITINYNERFDAKLPEVPTRVGYEFIGYDNQSVLQSLAQDIIAIQNIVVKAQWQPAIYTVNFFADGSGTWSEEVAYNGEVTSIDIAKIEANHPGYKLVGWSNHPDNPTLAEVKIKSDMTLTAIFREATYDLNITLAGCTDFKEQVLEQLKGLFGEYTFNSNGYTFKIKYNSSLLGLYNLSNVTDDNGQTHYFASLSDNVATMPNQSLNLTITYSSTAVKKISVTIVIVNGPSNASDITYEIVKNESNIQIPNPQYVGYNFIGWKTSNDDNITDINEYIKDNFSETSITVKAEYEIQKDYSITYAADLNSNIWQTKTEVAYGTTIIEALGEPSSIPGYIFAGWYYGDQAANDLKVTENLNSIVAKWEETDYSLKFTDNDKSIISNIYQYGNEFIVPTLSEADGNYSFGILNYKYYLATYYIEDTSGKKYYLNDLFISSANGNYIMGDLAEIAKDLGIEVEKDNNVTYLTFKLDPKAIDYTISVENSNISVTFNVEDTNITISGTAPETEDFYEFAGIGITENNLLELNKSYHFSELIALFSEDDLLNRRITLTSFETPITYTINGEKTFDVEGSYVDISDLTYGKEGYKFIGWLINEDDTYHYNSSIAVELLKKLMLNSTDGTITLIPKYEKEKYLVHFNTEGGSFIPSQTVLYGDKINKPSDPSLEGYRFQYWSDVKNGSEFNFDTPVSNDLTLYAVWQARKYTIKFIGEGTENIDSIVVSYDNNEKTFPNITSINGKNFLGYEYEGKLYNANDIIPNLIIDLNEDNKEITLTAKWEDYKVTIEYDANGAAGNISSQEIYYSKIDSLNLPSTGLTYRGYEFGGWSYNNINIDYQDNDFAEDDLNAFKEYLKSLIVNSDKNIVIKAIWNAKTYNITYKNVEGATNNNQKYYTYSLDSSVTIINPTKDGYTFVGWTVNDDTNLMLDYVIAVDTIGDITLTANFEVINYQISYKGIEGITISRPTSYNIEEEVTINPISKLGYTFLGWTKDDSEELQKTYKIVKGSTGDITLTANWQANTYVITLNPNEGSIDNDTVNYTYDLALSLGEPRREGYTFAGWTYNGEMVTKEVIANSATLNEDGNYIITILANWKINDYTLTITISDVNSEQISSITGKLNNLNISNLMISYSNTTITITINNIEYNADLTTILNSIKNECTAYDVLDDNGNKISEYTFSYVNNNITNMPAENISIEAKYTKTSVYVYFNDNSNVVNLKIAVGQTISSNELPIIPNASLGYYFAYWSDNKDGDLYDWTTIVNDTFTLYTVYKPITYTIKYNTHSGNTISDLTYVYDTELSLSNDSKVGYKFINWVYNDEVVTKEVIARNAIINSSDSSKGTITIDATYEAYEITIIFASGIGEGSANNITISYSNLEKEDYSIELPTNFVKLGYTFNGFNYDIDKVISYEDNNFANQSDLINYLKGLISTTNNETILTASYKANNYSITFNYNDDSNKSNTISVLYEQYNNELDTEKTKLYKYGYVFANWLFNDNVITTIAEIAEYATYNSSTKQYEITLDADYNIKSDVKIVLNIKDVLIEKSANIVSEINNNLKGYNFTIVEENNNDDETLNIIVTIIGTYNTNLNLQTLINSNKEYEINGITYKLGSYSYKYEDNNISSEAHPYNYDIIPGENIVVDVRYITNKILVYLNIDGAAHKELEPTINEDGTYTLSGNEEELELTPPTGYVWDGEWYSDSSYSTIYRFGNVETTAIELYAKYDPIRYSIKFNPNEGILNDTETKLFIYDKEAILGVDNPSRVGYTFIGWSYTGNTYTKDSTIKNLTSNNNDTIEFVAKWQANQYSIIFDANGGSLTSDSSKSFTYDKIDHLNVNDPIKVGYTFTGWSYDGNTYQSDSEINNLATSGEITFVATYKPITYTIIYDNNGGNGTINNQTFTYDEPQELTANVFTKIGYEFIGWNTSKDATTALYNDLQVVGNLSSTTNDEITLYAIWQANTYTIIYNNNGGIGNMANHLFIYDVAQKLTANVFTKTGYEFIGWSTSSNGEVKYSDKHEVINLSSINNAEITLYAIWEEIEFTIIFDANDGSGSMDNQVFTYDEYKALSENGFIRIGYTFIGWNTNKDATTALYNDLQVVGNLSSTTNDEITLYAIWKVNSYTITFNLAGGKASGNPQTFIYVETDLRGLLEQINNPTKDNYIFSHWLLNDIAITESTTLPARDIKLTAVYTPITYYVTFTNCDNLDKLEFNVLEVKDLPILTKEGYVFGGWLLGHEIISNTSSLTNDVTVSAIWNPITYNITYVLYGGANNQTNPNNYNVEESVEFASASKDGYKFIGWYLDSNFETEIKSTQDYTTNLVLYSKFEVETYTISLDLDGGSGISEVKYNVEVNQILPTPTKDGYKFIGFVDENNNIITETKDLIGDINLTAKYEIITYNINYSLDGGINDSNNPNSYNVEEIVEFNNPTKVGYKFSGWYLDSSFETPISSTTNYHHDLVLYAKFELITYTLILGENEIKYNVEKVEQLPILEKAGYLFGGWNIDGVARFNTAGLVGDYSGSAIWTLLDYNINYSLDGGINDSNNPDSYNVENIVEFNNPTKVGYTFVGWYLDSGYNIKITSTKEYSKDLVLYAKFIPNEYKISFNTKDSYIEGQTFNDVMISYNSKFGDKLPIPKAEFGITFHYWYYLDGDDKVIVNNNTIYDFTNDLVLYAYTEVTNYNIVYETNGGVNSDKNITNLTAFDVADGKTIELYNPTKAGYTFVGWYLDSNFNGDKIDVIDTALIENNINNVVRLYAKYEVHKFNINFYNGDTSNLISSIEVPYGQKITPIATPQKDGYIFDNWYLDGISIYDFNSPLISDLNIIALYKITEVKLSANINGELVDVVVTSIDGKGLQADTRISIELVTDSNIINSSNELLTEFGRISRLYNIKLVDANGNTIQPEGQVRIALTLPNEELKGNERFSIVNIKDDISGYTLFDSNSEDGTITFNTTHFSYYGIIITDKIVDWTWLWVLLGVVAFILLQFLIVLLIKNRRFRIRFISKGDVKIRELKYKKDEKVSLPKPQRLGYRFVGWYLDSEFKHPAHITTMPNENLILYARWQEDPLTIGLIVKNRKK